jgi:putative MFS transporter
MDNRAGINAGARLDRLPISRFHYRMFFLITLGAFFDGFDLFLAAGVLGYFVKSGFSSVQENATFVSMTFLGMVVGAWMAGILGDRYGRRFTYQFNLALFGFTSLAAAFAPNMTVLIVLRFIMGVGLGAELVICYPALIEFIPPSHRGRWLAMLGALSNMAAPIAGVVGYFVIPLLGWQYMFVIAGAGALVIWIARKQMPESPRWLESKGRLEEAEKVLAEIEREVMGSQPSAPAHTPVAQAVVVNAPLSVIFKPPLLQRTLIGMLIHVTIGFVIFGFFSWLPTFFVREGVTITASLGWSAAIALGAPIGAIIGSQIADRFDRKPTIIAMCLISAVFGSIYPFMPGGVPLVVMGFCLIASSYTLMSLSFGLYVSEMFPTEYRLRGMGACGTAGRISTAFIQYPILWLFTLAGVSGVVGVIVGLLLLLAAVVWLFGIETRQKPLEMIAADAPQESRSPSLFKLT